MTYQRNRPDVTLLIREGDRFGRWTVMSGDRIYKEVGSRNRPFLQCRCDCGTERLVAVVSLRHKQGSCGCGQREAAAKANTKDGSWKERQVRRRSKSAVTPENPTVVRRTRDGKVQQYVVRGYHGYSKTPLYRTWLAMRRRCSSEPNANSKFYGDRGIRVCKEWSDDFLAFRSWALANGYEPGLEIDRENADKDYTPENCRWITKRDNIKRARRSAQVEKELQRVARYLEADPLHSRELAAFLQQNGF